MSVRKVKAKIVVDEREALASSRKVKREMDGIEREANQAQTAVNRARTGDRSLNARFRGLLDRAKARGFEFREEDLTLGSAFKVSRQGISIRETYKKGRAGGVGAPLLRGSFGAMVAGQALGNSLEKAADIMDFIDANRNMTTGQIVQSVAQGASASIFQMSGANAILRGTSRLLGTRTDVYDNAFQLATGELSDVEQAIDAQAANRRAFFKWQEKQAALESKRREAAQEASDKLDAALEKTLAGLQTKVFRPKDIRVGRNLNRQLQRMYQSALEKAARGATNEAKEPLNQILQGEGR